MVAKLINKVLGYLGLILLKRSFFDRLSNSVEKKNFSGDIEIFTSNINADELRIEENLSGDMGILEHKIHTVEKSIHKQYKDLLSHHIHARWNIIDFVDEKLVNSSLLCCMICSYSGESSKFKKYFSDCIFLGGALHRFQCPECEVIFGPLKTLNLSKSQLSKEYEYHYQVFEEGDSTESEMRAFHSLSPKKSGVYLNYGCGGWSKTLAQLQGEGWNVIGFEPHLLQSSSEFLITDRNVLSTKKFDGIFSNNLLEHLQYPIDELIYIKSLLKPEARMAHATPCYEYLYEYTRFHLFFFLGKSKEVLASKAGLIIEKYEKDGEFMNCIFRSIK
jgi:hypothetical protein